MLDLGHEGYMEKMFAETSNPRVVVAKMVAEAVRENLSEPPIGKELLDQAVREAQKQADILIVLVLNLHDYVRSKCKLNHPYGDLLDERFTRILGQPLIVGKFVSKSWDL